MLKSQVSNFPLKHARNVDLSQNRFGHRLPRTERAVLVVTNHWSTWCHRDGRH